MLLGSHRAIGRMSTETISNSSAQVTDPDSTYKPPSNDARGKAATKQQQGTPKRGGKRAYTDDLSEPAAASASGTNPPGKS